jgi:hypothetical protein
MKAWQRTILILTVVLSILSLLLSACGPLENQHGSPNDGKDQVKAKGPDHPKKDKDKEKVKENEKGEKADRILICHQTGSAKKPYVSIRVSNNALKDGHSSHAGDLIPAPGDGCPKTITPQYP